MKILLVALFLYSTLFSATFSQIRDKNVAAINSAIKIYQKRLKCLNKDEAQKCIKKYPLDTHNDQLSLLMCNEFPESFYKTILQRDLKALEKERLCWGRALNEEEVKKCIKD